MHDKTEVNESLLNELKEQLRKNPALFESISEIVSLSKTDKCAESKSFDEVEGALIPKIQELGRQTLDSFVQSVEQTQVEELKSEEDSIKLREKKR